MARLFPLILVFSVSVILTSSGLCTGIDLLNTGVEDGSTSNSEAAASSIETGATDRQPGDGKGAGKGQYMIETIRDDQGNATSEILWIEDRKIQTHSPGSIKESSLEFTEGDSNSIELVLYEDQKNNLVMANGIVTDIIPNANIVKKFKEGQNAVIVWQDKDGTYKMTKVPLLSSMGNEPASSSEQVDSEELNDYQKERLGLTGSSAEATAGTDSTSSATDSNSDGNNTPDVNDSSDDGSSANNTSSDSSASDNSTGSNGSDEANNASSSSNDEEEEPINVPPVKEPGNKYGVDPVFSDSEIEAIVQAEIDAAKAAYKGEGLTLNDWGIAQGANSSTQITHSGGIDGYGSPIHYWLSQSGVRSKVDSAAGKKRSGLEKERESKIDEIKKQRAEKKKQQAEKQKAQQQKTTKTTNSGSKTTSNTNSGSSSVSPTVSTATQTTQPTVSSTANNRSNASESEEEFE